MPSRQPRASATKPVRKKFWSISRSLRFALDAADEDWAWDIQFRLRKGRRLDHAEWPAKPPEFIVNRKYCRVDDFPSFGPIMIVSNRVREVWEADAPGQVEFLPVRITGANLTQDYWAVNWVRVFDCLDEQSYNVGSDGERFVEVPIIDASRIPDDGILGVVKGYTVQELVRNDLRLKMIKAGIKGMAFIPVAHADGTNFIPFIRPDYSKTANDEPADTSSATPEPPLSLTNSTKKSTKRSTSAASKSRSGSSKPTGGRGTSPKPRRPA